MMSNWSTTSYVLDVGNNSDSGQFILGEPLNQRNRRSRLRLRTAGELFPEILDPTLDNDGEPTVTPRLPWNTRNHLSTQPSPNTPSSPTGRIASAACLPSCAPACGVNGTYSISWHAMGQPGAASAIWAGQNRRFSRVFFKAVGQPMPPANSTPSADENHLKTLNAL